jgi:hypothetical protein
MEADGSTFVFTFTSEELFLQVNQLRVQYRFYERLDDRMTEVFERFWKGSGRGASDVPLRHLLGMTEENHDKSWSRESVLPAKKRTKNLLSTSLEV